MIKTGSLPHLKSSIDGWNMQEEEDGWKWRRLLYVKERNQE